MLVWTELILVLKRHLKQKCVSVDVAAYTWPQYKTIARGLSEMNAKLKDSMWISSAGYAAWAFAQNIFPPSPKAKWKKSIEHKHQGGKVVLKKWVK